MRIKINFPHCDMRPVCVGNLEDNEWEELGQYWEKCKSISPWVLMLNSSGKENWWL